MKRRKRAIQALVVCGVLLLTGLFFWRWLGTVQPQVCRLPDGSTMTLVGTTYGRHHRLETRVRGQGLWGELQTLLNHSTEISEMDTPTNALVLWVRTDGAQRPMYSFDLNSRIEVSDTAGHRLVTTPQEYPTSPVLRSGNDWPLVIPIFPRLGTELTAGVYRLHDRYGAPDAVFHVTNPAPGSYSRWTPDPIPATRTDGDMKVTLETVSPADEAMQARITTYVPGGFGGRFGLGPRQKPWGQILYGEDRRVEAHIRVVGKAREQWRLSNMWVSDAAGNVWPGAMQGYFNYTGPTGPQISRLFYLAPVGAEPLRYTVECNRNTGAPFAAQEQWTLPAIEVPGIGKGNMIGLSHTEGDITLKVIGIAGPRTNLLKPPPVGIQPQQSIPAVYVEVTGACQPYLTATDENGRRIEGGGGQNIGDRWLKPDYMEFEHGGDYLKSHYSFGPNNGTRIILFPLKTSPSTKRINLTFALNKTRTFQFTVPADGGLMAR